MSNIHDDLIRDYIERNLNCGYDVMVACESSKLFVSVRVRMSAPF